MLEVRSLSKAYDQIIALDGVNLDVAPGEICGLLGRNGAGKTTLTSIIAGLRQPDSGSVFVRDIDAIAHPKEASRLTGFVPQELGVYPSLTAREGLRFFGELADLRGRLLMQRIDEVADALELGAFLDRPAGRLSGGEKRRLHTAMALLHRPPLLLLDEPTAGVDVHTRIRLLDSIRALAAESDAAVCYTTHYVSEVEALSASVAIIECGRIIARGQVGELIAEHAQSVIELTFEGPPPELGADKVFEAHDDKTLRVRTHCPESDLAVLLTRLGTDLHRLRRTEILRPSLESVFLSITGRRYSAEDEDQEATATAGGEME